MNKSPEGKTKGTRWENVREHGQKLAEEANIGKRSHGWIAEGHKCRPRVLDLILLARERGPESF